MTDAQIEQAALDYTLRVTRNLPEPFSKEELAAFCCIFSHGAKWAREEAAKCADNHAINCHEDGCHGWQIAKEIRGGEK